MSIMAIYAVSVKYPDDLNKFRINILVNATNDFI